MRMRPLVASDQAVLWELLHVALWDPPAAPPRPRAVLERADVRLYAEGWGRHGDVGVVATTVEGDVAGAAWVRSIEGARDPHGLAYVDDRTPQLGIALFAPYRHRGLGEAMLRAALAAARDFGYPAVSLTVHPDHPAIALYLRCSFVDRGLRGTYRLMVAVLVAPD